MSINETVSGENSVAITGTATGEKSRGVLGKSDWTGVKGEGDKGTGVWGTSKQWMGVYGSSESTEHGAGVMGEAIGSGVIGKSKTWMGVYGESESTTGGAGVWGEAIGSGVVGKSKTWMGVYGESESTTGGAGVFGEHKGVGIGVRAVSNDGVGLAAYSTTNEAIHAETNSNIAAIAAYNLNSAGTGFAVFAKKEGSTGFAGFFEGNVLVTKKLTVGDDIVLSNADCAEDFDINSLTEVEPGTVMVIDSEGALRESDCAYDKRVAGVISGAGDYKPGLVLDKQESSNYRMPIALMGKVYCKVDAGYGAIEVGDLLTTSPIAGHAMKADDPLKAFGTVIGKALRPLAEGQRLIPVLVALQ